MVRIGFSTSNGWISKAIRDATHSLVSHAFMLYDSADFGAEMILQAWWTEYEDISREKFEETNTIVDLIVPVMPLDPVMKFARDWLGTKYDFGGVIGELPVLAARALGRRIHNPWHSPGALYCSEAIARGLQLVNYPDADTLDPATTSPDDLLRFMRAPGHWR